MRIFEKDFKINFVDNCNRFVGFDYSRSCCEEFGYYLTREPKAWEDESEPPVTDSDINEDELDEYNFDPSFHNHGTFKLVSDKNGDVIYLELYNIHNGYYSHGFEMFDNGKLIYRGNL